MSAAPLRAICVLVAACGVAHAQPASSSAAASAASIVGHVMDAKSAPVADFTVIVFPTDRTKWSAGSKFLKLGRPGQDGSFEVSGLPPGEYFVAAINPIEGTDAGSEWQRPERLERLSFGARRVTLAGGDRHITMLRLIRNL